MNSEPLLTKRQQQILDFIQQTHQDGTTPSLREIATHFGFRSMTAAVHHVRALEKKGVLRTTPGQARSLRSNLPPALSTTSVVTVPIFGSIPAGLAEDRRQESTGCLSVDLQTLGLKTNARMFALEVKGDSMIGKHIVEGDYVILEHGRTPRVGDVVAALIDNESTLKTFLLDRGQPVLKAENPRYPKLIPAQELVIQGVMVALVRRVHGKVEPKKLRAR
jgi:repressor LexA